MKIKTELLKEHISEYIINNIEDFEAIEEITKAFEKNNIYCTCRHDF